MKSGNSHEIDEHLQKLTIKNMNNPIHENS
jgi:hypothetical protein